jgi:hypothetical protein
VEGFAPARIVLNVLEGILENAGIRFRAAISCNPKHVEGF